MAEQLPQTDQIMNEVVPFTVVRDVVILIINRNGEFHKNMTPAQWKAASEERRFYVAEANDYAVGGFELYRDCTMSIDANKQVVVEECREALRIVANNSNWRSKLRREAYTVMLNTTVNAVVTKHFEGPLFQWWLVNGITIKKAASNRIMDEYSVSVAKDYARAVFGTSDDLTEGEMRTINEKAKYVREETAKSNRLYQKNRAMEIWQARLDQLKQQVNEDHGVDNREVKTPPLHVHVCRCGFSDFKTATKSCDREHHDTNLYEHHRRVIEFGHNNTLYLMELVEELQSVLASDQQEWINDFPRLTDEEKVDRQLKETLDRLDIGQAHGIGDTVRASEDAAKDVSDTAAMLQNEVPRLAQRFYEFTERTDDHFAKMGATFEKAAETFEGSNKKLNETLGAFAAAAGVVTLTGGEAEQTLKSVGGAANAVSSILDGFFDTNRVAAFVARATSFVMNTVAGSFNAGTPWPFTRFLMQFFTIFDVAGSVVALFMDHYKDGVSWMESLFAKKSNEAVRMSHIGEAHGMEPQSLPTLLTALVGTIVTGAMPSKTGMKTVGDTLRVFNSAVPASKNMGDLTKYLVSYLPECVKRWVYFICPSEKVYAGLVAGGETRKWMEDVVETLTHPEVLIYDVVAQQKVLALHKQGTKILEEMALDEDMKNTQIWQLLTRYQDRIEKARVVVDTALGISGTRKPPVCLYIYGSPGVGKSTISSAFIDLVCPVGIPDELKVYARSCGVKHWDGYKKQFCVLCDDFFQNVKTGEDLEEMLPVISNNMYFPPLASLSDPNVGMKGTTMTSELVILLSNTENPVETSRIRSMDAFYRRRTFMLKMVPREDLCENPEADWSVQRFRPGVVKNMETWEHVDFYKVDTFDKNKQVKMTFTEVLEDFGNVFCNFMDNEKRILEARKKNTSVSTIREKLLASNRIGVAHGDESGNPFGSSMGSEEEELPCGNVTNKMKTKEAMDYLRRKYQKAFGKVDELAKEEKLPTEIPSVKDMEKKRPKWAVFLMIALGTGILSGLIYLLFKYLVPKDKMIAESSPERMKFKRGLALKRTFVAESAKAVPVAERWLFNLKRAFPDEDLVPLVDIVTKTRDLTDAYNKQLADGVVPEQGEVEKMEFAFEEMHRQLHKLVPQWPETKESVSVKDFPEPKMQAHGCVDQNAMAFEEYQAVKAMVNIQFIKEDGSLGTGSGGFMVRGGFAVFPRHIFMPALKEILKDGRKHVRMFVKGRNPMGKEIAFDFNRMKVIRGDNDKMKDAVVYDFGSEVEAARDITSMFIRKADLCKIRSTEASIMTLAPSGPSYPINRRITDLKLFLKPGVYADAHGNDYTLIGGLHYKLHSQPGYCGGLLILHNTDFPQKALGLHVSGAVGSPDSYGEALTYEQLMKTLELFKPPVLPAQGMPYESCTFARPFEMVAHASDATVLGVVPDGVAPNTPTKSRIYKSPIHGKVYEPEYGPAPLRDDDPRIAEENRGSMITKGVMKFCSGRPSLDPEIVKEVKKEVGMEIRSVLRNEPRFVATEDEAINGITGLTHCKPMELDTTPGLWRTLDRPAGVKGKRGLIDGEPGKRKVIDERLRLDIDDRIESAKKLQRVRSYWQAMLKDELRPLSKIALGKARTFMGANIDFTIVFRMYCLAFCSALFRHHNDEDFWFAPGVNPLSFDWTLLMQNLMKTSSVGFDGDYGNYDGTLPAVLIDAVCDIMNDWFDDDPDFVDTVENKNVRRTLFHEMIHTWIVAGNVVIEKHAGNPSGNPATTPINCTVNRMLMMYVWMKVAPVEYRSAVFFREHTRMKVFGDDIISAVTPWAAEFFNMRTIAQCLSEIGIEFTDAGKTGSAMGTVKPLVDCTFLKAGFRPVGHMYYPLLAKASIQELTNWVASPTDQWRLCQENLNDSLKFMWFWGKEDFEEHRDKIIKACIDVGKIPQLLPEEAFASAFAKNGQMPGVAFHDDKVDWYDEFEWERVGVAHGGDKPFIPVVVFPEDANRDAMIAIVKMDGEWTKGQAIVVNGPGYYGQVVHIGEAHGTTSNPMPHISDEGSSEEKVAVSSKVGITMIEQTEAVEVERVGATNAASNAHKSMVDYTWTVAKLSERPTLVGTYNWSTTDGLGNVKNTFLLPSDMISDNSVTHTAFGLYANWRGNMEIQISVTGTKFVTGRLIAYFVPMSYPAYAAARYLNNWPGVTSLPHVLLDPSEDTIAILKVNYVNPRNFIELREPQTFDILGTMVVRVLNPLAVGDGQPTSVSYSINVSFTDSTFTNPVPTEISLKRYSRKQIAERIMMIAGEKQRLLAQANKIGMKWAHGEDKDEEPERIGEAHGLTYSAIYNDSHDNLEGSTKKVQGDVSAKSELKADVQASIPTLDKPGVYIPPVMSTRMAMGDFANGVGPEFLERLNLQGGSGMSHTTPETFGTTMDEMSFDYLKKVQNLSTQINWSTGTAAGAMLYKDAIAPFSQSLTGGVKLGAGVGQTGNWFTTLDWLAAKFSFWNGDMKARLQLIASQYHTGKLFVSLMYGTCADPSTMTLEQVSGGRGFYLSLNDLKQDFELVLNWSAPVDVLRVPDGPTSWGSSMLSYACGTWSIWVVEQLKAAPGVPTTISMNIWKYGGDNFEVYHLGDNNACLIPWEGHFVPKKEKETKAERIGVAHSSVAPREARPVNPFGENIRNIADLLSRKVLVCQLNNATQPNYQINIGKLLFAQPDNPSVSTGDAFKYNGNSGVLRWFGSGYRGFRGSVRFRVEFMPNSGYGPSNMPNGGQLTENGICLSWTTAVRNSATFDDIDLSVLNLASAVSSGGSATRAYSQYAIMSAPATFTDPGANYATIEIPYISMYKFLMLVVDPVVEGSSKYNSPGSLIVCMPGVDEITKPDGTLAAVTAGYSKVWASGGDELRFGIFLGPPATYCLAVNVGATTYTV